MKRTVVLKLSGLRSAALPVTWCLALALACASAGAQVAAPFIGKWKASWQSDRQPYEAVMTVTESGGTWQTATRARSNPCFGREVPMKVESSSATEVQLLLQFSETIPGCNNATVNLKAGPDGAVTGTRSKFELTLVKQ